MSRKQKPVFSAIGGGKLDMQIPTTSPQKVVEPNSPSSESMMAQSKTLQGQKIGEDYLDEVMTRKQRNIDGDQDETTGGYEQRKIWELDELDQAPPALDYSDHQRMSPKGVAGRNTASDLSGHPGAIDEVIHANYDEIRNKINYIKQEMHAVTGNLSADLEKQITEGNIPNYALAQKIIIINKKFSEIRDEISDQLKLLKPGNEYDLDKINSIQALEELNNYLMEYYSSKSSYEKKYRQAINVLELVLRLAHVDEINFLPLKECQRKANLLWEEILEYKWPDIHPTIESLADGTHDLARILAWISESKNIRDDEWAEMHDFVFNAVDRKLATAITRGKIIILNRYITDHGYDQRKAQARGDDVGDRFVKNRMEQMLDQYQVETKKKVEVEEKPPVPPRRIVTHPDMTGSPPEARPAEAAVGNRTPKGTVNPGEPNSFIPEAEQILPERDVEIPRFREESGHTSGIGSNENLQKILLPTFKRVMEKVYESILLKSVEKRGRVVLVCSANKGEGTTMVALGLAMEVAAKTQKRVLLIDANDFNHNLVKMLSIIPDARTSPAGSLRDEFIIKQTNIPDLWVLGTGLVSEKDVFSYDSLYLKRTLDSLLPRYPFVIIDGPPLNWSGDSVVYASQADSILIVVHAGVTRTPILARAISSLPPGANDKVEVILNRRTFAIPMKIYNKL